jgi:predicted DNA-binding protein (UPF0251 family)
MVYKKIKPRCIEQKFNRYFFKPRGISLRELQIIRLGHEEMEAIRLIDVEHLNQQDAAEKMQVSRATMQRVIDSAREKVGKALIAGQAIEIEGGNYIIKPCKGRRRHGNGNHTSIINNNEKSS